MSEKIESSTQNDDQAASPGNELPTENTQVFEEFDLDDIEIIESKVFA